MTDKDEAAVTASEQQGLCCNRHKMFLWPAVKGSCVSSSSGGSTIKKTRFRTHESRDQAGARAPARPSSWSPASLEPIGLIISLPLVNLVASPA